MGRLVRHRQTKGAATDMQITYNHRATFLLYTSLSVGKGSFRESELLRPHSGGKS